MESSRPASRPGPTCSAKSRWRVPRRRARPGRESEKSGTDPRRGAEPPLRRGRPAHRAGAEGGRDRRACQRSRRFLPRPAFRRLSRGDGPCPASRHGDPHLRRVSLHDGPCAPRASLAANGTRPTRGTGRDRQPRRSSNSRPARSSPIAAAGAQRGCRRSWESAWSFVGAKGSLVWDGADSIRIEALAPGDRNGLFDPVAPVEPPPLAEDDRIDGHFGVLSDFVAAVRAGSEPETASRDNIRSLAMVFGAIESAEASRRVSIVV